jgi:hypothetical protein
MAKIRNVVVGSDQVKIRGEVRATRMQQNRGVSKAGVVGSIVEQTVDEVSKREEIEEPRVRGAGGGSKGN